MTLGSTNLLVEMETLAMGRVLTRDLQTTVLGNSLPFYSVYALLSTNTPGISEYIHVFCK